MNSCKRLLATVVLSCVVALVVAACSNDAPTPPATTTPFPTLEPVVSALAGVPGIVDSNNLGWPRQVEAINGTVTIEAKPLRIHTVSLGHDEVTYALVPAERVVAVGRFTQREDFSSVAHLAERVPGIGRDPEQILAQNPDIVIASPFSKRELLDALTNAGVTVVQTELENTAEGRIQNILLMGYTLGEEERAIELAGEVQARVDSLLAVTQAVPEGKRPRVAFLTRFSDKIYTAGTGSTEGGIVDAAGGFNVAAEAGLERNPVISLESIIAMKPEIVVIAQPADGAEEFKAFLLGIEALSEVPAIRDERVFIVTPKLYTTLSFWNVRGAEELAKLLWPERLGGRDFPPFSFPA